MAGTSVGVIYAEIDLDTSRYTKAQQSLLRDASQVALGIEQNYKNLGIKSSASFDLMRAQAVNAFDGIKHSANATANDIARAQEAINAKMASLNAQQFGGQTTTSFVEDLKTHWIAASAAIYGALEVVRKGFEMVNEGVKIQQAKDAFSNAAKAIGADADKMVGKIKELTNSTVDDDVIMQKSMKWMSAGMGTEKVNQIWEISRVSARRMGIDVKDAAEQIGDAIEMMRTKTLLSFGLITPAQTKLISELKATGNEAEAMKVIMANVAVQSAINGKALENESERWQQYKAGLEENWEWLSKVAAKMTDMFLLRNSSTTRGQDAWAARADAQRGGSDAALQGSAAWKIAQAEADAAEASKGSWGATYLAQAKKEQDEIVKHAEAVRDAARAAEEAKNAFAGWRASMAELDDQIKKGNPNLSEYDKALLDLDIKYTKLYARAAKEHQDTSELPGKRAQEEANIQVKRTYDTNQFIIQREHEKYQKQEQLALDFDAFYQDMLLARGTEEERAIAKIVKADDEGFRKILQYAILENADLDKALSARVNLEANTQKQIDEIVSKAATKKGVLLAETTAKERLTDLAVMDRLGVGTVTGNMQGQLDAHKQLLDVYEKLLKGAVALADKDELGRKIAEQKAEIEKQRLDVMERQYSLTDGMVDGWAKLFREQKTAYQNGADIAQASADAMTNAFESFFDYTSDGFLKFDKLATGVLNDVYKALMKALVIQPMVSGLSGLLGGLGGIPVGGEVPISGGVDWGRFPAFASGTNYVPSTGLAMVHQGEKIIPAGQNGGGTNVYVVNNVPGTTTDQTETKRADGGTDITIVVDQIMSGIVNSGRGNFNRAMRTRYNAKPVLAGR